MLRELLNGIKWTKHVFVYEGWKGQKTVIFSCEIFLIPQHNLLVVDRALVEN
jgi:hypothetical protein